MLISVSHRTHYKYEEEAAYTIQSLRLTPMAFAGQKILSWKLTCPNFDRSISFTDCFGNQVHTITIVEPHSEVLINVEGVVETTDCSGVVNGLEELAPPSVYLRPTPRTRPDETISELAEKATGTDLLSTLHELNKIILDTVEYERGSTDTSTSAVEALANGKGVCQDHTHIFLSAARTLNIPARYVTGYIVTEDKDEAHHAWAEVFVAGLGWVGFDVSNQLCPTDSYVRLACGLDAEGAAPVRGTVQGAEKETLDVSVEVQQQQSQ